MMKLSQQQVDDFLVRLQELKTSLLSAETTGSEAEETVELDQTRMGRLSRMDALQTQAMSKETGRRRRLVLRGIEAALLRIENGGFGECSECDDTINPRRLEADPTIELCIACAEAAE